MADFVQFLTIPGAIAGDAWESPILAPNGMIYAVPTGTTATMLKIDPTTSPDPTVSTIPLTPPSSERWRKAILAPNGYIYAPRRSGAGTSWLKFDPTTETATYITGTTMTVDGITLVGNIIYGFNNVTSSSPIAVRLDTTTDTHTTVAGATYTGTAWGGAQNAAGTFFYQVPGSAAAIGKFDTATEVRTSFGAFGVVSDKWVGAVRASNGIIYCAPYSSSSGVLKIDPATDATSFLFGGLPLGGTWRDPFIGPNGWVWMLPGGAPTPSSVFRFDPTTESAVLGAPNFLSIGSIHYRGGVTVGDKVFAVPNSGTSGVLYVRVVPDGEDTLLWTLCTESPVGNWQNTGVGGNAFDFMEVNSGVPVPGYTLCNPEEFGTCQMLKFPSGAWIGVDQTQPDINPYDEPWCFEMFFRISNAQDGKQVYMVGDGFGFDGGVWFECTASGPDKLYVERGLEGTGSTPLVQLIAEVPKESRGCVHHMAWRCDPGAPRTELWLNGAFADGGDYTYSDWFSGGSSLNGSIPYGNVEEAGDGSVDPEMSHIRWSAGYVTDATIQARGYSIRGCCPGFNTPCVPIVNVLV